MAERIENAEGGREMSPPIGLGRVLAVLASLAVGATLVMPVVASIRGAGRTAAIEGGATPLATRISNPGTTPAPGRGALPLCPTTRGVARPVAEAGAIPGVEADPGAESVDRMTQKGRL